MTFDSIQPQPLSPGAGYDLQPIDLAFVGNYYSLTDFLFRLRKLVSVHRGTLDATGRLFSVGRIDFAPGEDGFPADRRERARQRLRLQPGVCRRDACAAAERRRRRPTTPSTDAVASGVTP